MKPKLKRFQVRLFWALALGMGSAFSLAAASEDWADTAPAKASIPWPACRGGAGRSQIGAKAGGDYPGDGLAVSLTPGGARLRIVFQRLEGEATREGLWLASTAAETNREKFRVVAAAVGRAGEAFGVPASAGGASESFQRFGLTAAQPAKAGTSNHLLPRTGTAEVADKLARFVRPGVTEEYSVSMDGLRQRGQLHCQMEREQLDGAGFGG